MSKMHYSNYYCYFNLWRVASVLFNIQESSIDLLSFELLNTLQVCVLSRLNTIIRPIYNVKGEVLISTWDNAFLQRNLAISIINFYLTAVYLISECNVVMGGNDWFSWRMIDVLNVLEDSVTSGKNNGWHVNEYV